MYTKGLPDPNPYRGESDVTIPAEFLSNFPEGGIKLRLKFTHSAYKELERLTGQKHFARFQNSQGMMGEDFIAAGIYAGTRKTKPDLTVVQIEEWLENTPPSKLPVLYKEVVEAFATSIKGAPSEKEVLRKSIETGLGQIKSMKALEEISSFVEDPKWNGPEYAEGQQELPLTQSPTNPST